VKVTQVGEVIRASGVSELLNASHQITTVLALARNYKTLVHDYKNKNKTKTKTKTKNKNKNKLSSLVNHYHC
jgi:hypothetical protein